MITLCLHSSLDSTCKQFIKDMQASGYEFVSYGAVGLTGVQYLQFRRPAAR